MKAYKNLAYPAVVFLFGVMMIAMIAWSNSGSGLEQCIEEERFKEEIETDISTSEDKRVLPWLNVFFGTGDLYDAEGIYYYPGEDFVSYEDVIASLENDSERFKGEKVDTRRSLHIGSKDAHMVIIIFTNHKTDSYENFVENIFPRINEKYIKEGKARLVFKDISTEPGSMEVSNKLRCKAAYANDPADIVK